MVLVLFTSDFYWGRSTRCRLADARVSLEIPLTWMFVWLVWLVLRVFFWAWFLRGNFTSEILFELNLVFYFFQLEENQKFEIDKFYKSGSENIKML